MISLGLFIAAISAAHARDDGDKFNGANGHWTQYAMRAGAYWVPIGGKWFEVPENAVLDAREVGNPTGDAVVWYSVYGEHVVIRCFVPGSGT